MENDPNKKESKGKRIFKKAIRRNSKSSNSSQNSTLEAGIGATPSKSLENKTQSSESNISVPLPKPNGITETEEPSFKIQLNVKSDSQNQKAETSVGLKTRKIVDIQENHNEVFGDSSSASKKNAKSVSAKLELKDQQPSSTNSVKKGLKRVCLKFNTR